MAKGGRRQQRFHTSEDGRRAARRAVDSAGAGTILRRARQKYLHALATPGMRPEALYAFQQGILGDAYDALFEAAALDPSQFSQPAMDAFVSDMNRAIESVMRPEGI